MRFVSLFAGVGGFDLGLERTWHTCVGQVEIDPACRAVLEKHWPDVPRHDDVRTAVEWAEREGLVGNVELVCGGFPCQDVSIAGRRAGLAGDRSGLFFDAVRFAQQVQAQTILLENVPGLLSSNQGRDFGVVLTELANAGYRHIEWRVLDSQFFGVPQRRRRLFIVADTRNRSAEPVFIESESMRWNSVPRRTERQDTAGTIEGRTTARMLGFGHYAIDDTASALKARDYKDATDLVVQQIQTGTVDNGRRDVDPGGGDTNIERV